jgi:hypothetical protein
MTNGLMRGSRPRGFKYPEWQLGQRGEATGTRNGPGRPAWADRLGPTSAQLPACFVWHRFPSLLDPSPFCMWALVVSFTPSWMKLLVSQDLALFWLGPRSLSSSRVRSLGFLESSLLHCMTCIGFKVLSRCSMNLSRKSCFNVKTLHKH